MTAQALAEELAPRGGSPSVELSGDEVFRHRLHVIASSAVDVVAAAGGWLADRALTGWDVFVYLPDGEESLPLRVLGVTPCSQGDLSTLAASVRREHRRKRRYAPTALAVDAAMIDADPAVRRCIDSAMADVSTEVVMWGAVPAAGVGAHLVQTSCRASSAGLAFKSHALKAALATDVPCGDEILHTRASQPTWVGCFPRREAQR
ncbi:hypothetical protein FR943_06265 [Mycobacterium sp. TNTM28]|uniref:Uncharacterized protein n=1 Tax=[Mycobacterium] fortunisiensis TaxID=2600579 RepID=A0ABS6KJI5_9MYCO|nr:hypothetical protein [[Mycobacterium] fortunisiensis]MBU9763446.1 hypothetical protein [[Mycobacterium] fortunisiensis]